MKKTIIFLIGLLLVSVQSMADTRATALLLHNGQGKSFDADQLQQAVNEAVSGDTICLSEGAFVASEKDTLLIDKEIAIIGAGEGTIIGGNVNISIPEIVFLHRIMFDAVHITGSVEIKKDVNGVSLRKCWIGGWFQVVDCEARDIRIERCYLYQFPMLEGTMSSTIVNSIIGAVGKVGSVTKDCKEGHDINFINCSIMALLNCNWAATYTNCVIAGYGYYSKVINNYFINTLLNSTSQTCWVTINNSNVNINRGIEEKTSTGNLKRNCYQETFSFTWDANRNNFPSFTITQKDFAEKGFLGTDGTIIGAYGGTTPYSLEADGIHIKESVLKVDPATRQLNVTLKVE